jgi:alkaline phosphatase D
MLCLSRPLLLAPLLLLFVPQTQARQPDPPLTRIAFGSCADQDRPLPIFDTIAATKPELLLLIGDNIYADIDHTTGKLLPAAKITRDLIRQKYDTMAKVPGYQKLRATCPILATWDDHDFGLNDAGTDFTLKDESQRLFLDFFGVKPDDPRRTQKGVYMAATYGPPGKRVQVIMLDTRYHRSPLTRAKAPRPGERVRPYLPNTGADATVLGAEQWKWLEGELRKPAEVRLLVSSIQVIADDHPFEKWGNFPDERARLYDLIASTKANGVVILSGDRHLAEVSLDTRAVGYPLYDVTSSGLNQGFKGWREPEKNSNRVAAMPYGDNFGMVLIDWSGDDPRLTLQVRDGDGDVTCGVKVRLSTLKGTGIVAARPKLPEGVLTPAEAARKGGEQVTVQYVVASTGGQTNLHLNSEKDYRSKDNFAVVLTPKGKTGAWEKATGATFQGKTIRVTGAVKLNKDNPQLEVTDEKQLVIVEK